MSRLRKAIGGLFVIAILGASTPTPPPDCVPAISITDGDVVAFANGVERMDRVTTEDLAVRVMKLPNPAGSAGAGSGEITHDVYVAVSTIDTLPEQALFRLPDLYNPRVDRTSEQDGVPVVHFSYGPADDRGKLQVTASLDALDVTCS